VRERGERQSEDVESNLRRSSYSFLALFLLVVTSSNSSRRLLNSSSFFLYSSRAVIFTAPLSLQYQTWSMAVDEREVPVTICFHHTDLSFQLIDCISLRVVATLLFFFNRNFHLFFPLSSLICWWDRLRTR
jgi:hypothetical protein